MRDFKIRVNPKQSELVQKTLFELGYDWVLHEKTIINLNSPWLTVRGKNIFCAHDRGAKIDLPELTFEQFKQVYMKEKDEQLVVTKERVLEAASKCAQAREALKTLFPEAFEEDKYFDLSKLQILPQISNNKIFTDDSAKAAGFNDGYMLEVRGMFEYHNKAFYLDDAYNWEIVRDDDGQLCLLPTKRDKGK